MTTSADEWGLWIAHDGKGCPLRKGTIGEARLRGGRLTLFRALCGSTIKGPYVPGASPSAWEWAGIWPDEEVIEYRVRQPRALIEMREVVERISRMPADARRVSA